MFAQYLNQKIQNNYRLVNRKADAFPGYPIGQGNPVEDIISHMPGIMPPSTMCLLDVLSPGPCPWYWIPTSTDCVGDGLNHCCPKKIGGHSPTCISQSGRSPSWWSKLTNYAPFHTGDTYVNPTTITSSTVQLYFNDIYYIPPDCPKEYLDQNPIKETVDIIKLIDENIL